jgi:PTH1 family peptidyl-tRNA hydrolase
LAIGDWRLKLIVGLGNPGSRYQQTRHNVGFEVVDLLAARHHLSREAAPKGIEALTAKWQADGAVFAKPLTFMNLSGQAIAPLLQFYKIDIADLLVIVDEVQLELGRLRTRPSGSAGGHNGLKSVVASLGTEAFPRMRIGVGRGDGRIDLAARVLAKFDADERPVIEQAAARAADAAERFISGDILTVMNEFNRKEEQSTDSEDNRQL